MSDLAEKKDIIKKHVRALLISSPVPLTVNELKRDFHNFIGEPLDYRGMGYSTIEDYFRDIDDAVCIGYKNGSMTLTANADETTKHIEKLVSKQKVTNKKKYAVYRNRGHNRAPPRYYQQSSESTAPPRHQGRRSLPPQPVVPAYVRNQMKELLKSFPYGITVDNLDSAFSRIFGTGINFRNYGFLNQHEFLQALGDILIVKLVDCEWRVVSVGFRESEVHAARDTKMKPQVAPTEISPKSSNKTRPSKGRGRRRLTSECSDGAPGYDAHSVGSHEEDNLELEIQKVLEKHPNGIWASRFSYEYTVVHGKALNYRENGHFSIIDFLSAMPNIVRTFRPTPQGDWLLYDARLPVLQDEAQQTRTQKGSGKSIEQETKEAIQIILSSHPCGIPVKDFPGVFKEHTSRKLPLQELGFDTSQDFLLSLADSVLQFAYNGSEMIMFSPDAELPNEESEPVMTVPSNNPQLANYPSDVVGPGCHFVPVMLPDPEQYVEMYVTNVVNPGLFWIMLRHKTKSLALESLMDRLDEAYDNDSKKDPYKMPESLMVPGQVCATLFPEDNNWHRGVIIGSNDAGFIEVYYVDYGNTNSVQRDTIRFLKTEFLTLPAQAVQSRLANTHPPSGVNGKWTKKGRNRLLELTCHRPLVAYVFDIKSQKMSICLTDTNNPNVDIHINDVMVSEGLAMFQPDETIPVTSASQKQAMEPDYGHVFGWNTTEAPRLPYIAQAQSQGQTEGQGQDTAETELQQEEPKQAISYVKWIQLTESHILHLINLEREAYIVSAEISELFWEEDILTSMLKKKRVDLQKRVLSSYEYPDLFKELVRYNVKSLNTDAASQQFLTLYKLESLPVILRLFEHESETLIKAVEELHDKFDPDSPYWKCGETAPEKEKKEISVDEDIKDEELPDLQLSMEEKQMALQALQFKRKRILQSMMNNPGSLTDETVNQLNNCEVEIMVIKQELEEQKSKVLSKPPPGSQNTEQFETIKMPGNMTSTQQKNDPQTENQRVIQNIMASTTKPIATANIMTKAVTSTTSSKPVTTLVESGHQTVMTENLVPQSTTGYFPGMMGMPGMPNMAFAQQQRFVNPFLMAQTGFPLQGMPSMTGNQGMVFDPSFHPGLLPNLNPLLFQLQTGTTAANIENNNHTGTMPSIGRGQGFNQNTMGILPGLMPLLQNLSVGRGGIGRGGGGSNNNQ